MSLENILEKEPKNASFFRSIFLVSTNPRINGGSYSKSVIRERKRQQNYPGTIHPHSDFRFCWDLMMCLVLLMCLVEEPVQIAFYTLERDEVAYRALTIISLITSIIFYVDIALNFCTGWPDIRTGNVVLDKHIIFRKYIKSWFLIDFVSSAPLDSIYYFIYLGHPSVMEHHNIFKVVRLLTLFKFFRLFRVLQCLQRIEKAFKISELRSRLLNILITIIAVIHWLSCFHWLAADLFNPPGFRKPGSWISKTKLWEEQRVWFCYINSALRALSNMVSAGYGGGDAPSEPEDVVMTLITMAVGCSCFGLYIGTMGSIMQNVNAPRKKFDEMMLEVEEYMKFRKIPHKLQDKIRAYYGKRYREHYFNEGSILENISGVLKHDILIHNCKHLLEGVPLFKELPDIFLKTIVEKLKFEVYLPNDVIIEFGRDGEAMYFIEEGMVKVTSEVGQLITMLESGDYFGEMALAMQNNHKTNANVIANDYCDIYRLEREDFNDVFKYHPEVLEKIHRVAQIRLKERNAKFPPNLRVIHE